MERNSITPFSIDIKKEHLSSFFLQWYEEYLTPENCDIVSFKFSISTHEHNGLYFSPDYNGEIKLRLQWNNKDKTFYAMAPFMCFVDFSRDELTLYYSFSDYDKSFSYKYFFNEAFIEIIEGELERIKDKADKDFPELRRILDEELDKKLKVGDYVKVSGTLTGYGELKGYITDIDDRFVSVQYDGESRIIANGEKGKVGLLHFFTKDK